MPTPLRSGLCDVAGVTSLEPQQACAPRPECAGAEGAGKEDLPLDQQPLGPLLPIPSVWYHNLPLQDGPLTGKQP